jgi:hypothetical protein
VGRESAGGETGEKGVEAGGLRCYDPEDENQAVSGLMRMAEADLQRRFVLCIENKDSEDLEKRKIYVVVPDEEAEKEGYLRVIDESGADYLYPASYFILVELPAEAQQALRVAG